MRFISTSLKICCLVELNNLSLRPKSCNISFRHGKAGMFEQTSAVMDENV